MKKYFKNNFIDGVNIGLGFIFGFFVLTGSAMAFTYINPGVEKNPGFLPFESNVLIPFVQGLPGPQGLKGDQGPSGAAGAKGDPGDKGEPGGISCNWDGQIFLSSGWDGPYAWNHGVKVWCMNQRVFSFLPVGNPPSR